MLKGAKQTSVALGETLRLALDALRSHKLRSFLTLLGVILAVTTLVAVMSVVEGLNRYISDRVANLGANVFIVDRFGIITNWDEFVKAQRRPTIRVEEYEALPRKSKWPNSWPRMRATWPASASATNCPKMSNFSA